MTIDQIEKSIKKLKKRVCCLLATDPIPDGQLSSVRATYEKLRKTVLPTYTRRLLLEEELDDVEKLLNILHCRVCSTVTLTMQTLLDTDTLNYPVGVFNVDGDYIGIADDQTEYLTLWNSDLANQAHGTLEAGSTPLEFKLPTGTPLTAVRGLRFYTWTGPANMQIFIGDNDIVVFGANIKIGSVDGTSISTDTRREWNRFLFTVPKSRVVVDTVRTLTCTGYTANSNLYVFHNEDSEYSAVSHSFGFVSVSGYLPLATKAVFYTCQLTTNFNNILNWNELTNLYSWITYGSGGGVWGFTPSTGFPTQLINTTIGQQLTQLQIAEITNVTTGSTLSFVSDTNYPMINNLAIIGNGVSIVTFATGNESFFLNIPKVTDVFIWFSTNTTQAGTTLADDIWNNIATALNGVIPTGPTKVLRVNRTSNVTAASLTARNYLIGQGWTVQLT